MEKINLFLYNARVVLEVLGTLIAIGGPTASLIAKHVTKKEKRSKKWKMLWWIVGALCFLIGGSGLLYANSLIMVPNVEGKLYSNAKNILDGHKLDYNIEQGRENCKVERQTPEAGSVVRKGTEINLQLEELPAPTTPPSPTIPTTPTPTNTPVPATPTPTNTPTPTHIHDYTWNVFITKEPTCTSVGIRRSVCECGASREETISKLAHTTVKDAAVKATCTTDGKTEGSHCTVCGTVLIVPSPIAAKGHKEVTVAGKEATCTETGLTDGKKCSVCDVIIVAQAAIPRTNHVYDNVNDAYCNVCNEFRAVECQITYNSNGGSSVATQTVTYGKQLDSLPIPTREQYTFDGWLYNGSIVNSITVTGNITLTASWTPYKTMYVYYHYTTGESDNTAVCPDVLVDWGISSSRIYREELWVNEPLYTTKSVVYRHSNCGGKYGCIEDTLRTYIYRDTNYSVNDIVWYDNQASEYSQSTISVPASTEEGVRR